MNWEQQAIDLVRLLVAIIAGGLVGIERETAGKPAGLRTHMLVCAASCLFVLMGIVITDRFEEMFGNDIIMSDPIRVIQAIAVGISFIGAGVIIQLENQERVKNLTTAASILFTSALGIAVALDQYVIVLGAAILVVIVNRIVHDFEAKVLKTDEPPSSR